jgi:tripartite-type tricarboxylate transporter receptor subunit TctC
MKLEKPVGALLAWGLLLATAAWGQPYPAKPVHVVIPFAPGGATDIQARVLFKEMGEQLRQPFVIENRPGAGGMIGAEAVARSAPDGYTALFTTASIAINATLARSNIKFDPLKDLAPVSLVSATPLVLVVHPGLAAKTTAELIAHLKANPDKLNAAVNVPGSTSHLAAELFKQLAGVSFTTVTYKGGGLSMAALMSGEVQFQFAEGLLAAPQIRGGKIRPLALATATPSSLFPGLPTVSETVSGFLADNWFAMFAPGATPREAIAALNGAVKKGLAAPAVRKIFDDNALISIGSTPEELGEAFKRDVNGYAEVIRKGNISVTP